ncbi:MAG: DUF6230 family protein [Sporichthyaceae bacterium]
MSAAGASASEVQASYGTRWRVVAFALIPTALLLAVVGSAVAAGALAVSFASASGTVSLRTAGLNAEDFAVAVASVSVADVEGGSSEVPHARIGVGPARINGLCLAHQTSMLGLAVTLLIEGGDSDPSTFEIRADALTLDVRDVRAEIGAGGEVQVNKNGGDVAVAALGGSLDPTARSFGLQASTARLSDINAIVRNIAIPDLLSVPNFRITVAPGSRTC